MEASCHSHAALYFSRLDNRLQKRVEIASFSVRSSTRVIRGRGKRELSPEGVSGVRGKPRGTMRRRRRRWPKICARKNRNAGQGRRRRRASRRRRKSHPRSMTSFPAMLSPPSRTSAQAFSSSPYSLLRCPSLICNSFSDCLRWRSQLRCISLRFKLLILWNVQHVSQGGCHFLCHIPY